MLQYQRKMLRCLGRLYGSSPIARPYLGNSLDEPYDISADVPVCCKKLFCFPKIGRNITYRQAEAFSVGIICKQVIEKGNIENIVMSKIFRPHARAYFVWGIYWLYWIRFFEVTDRYQEIMVVLGQPAFVKLRGVEIMAFVQVAVHDQISQRLQIWTGNTII